MPKFCPNCGIEISDKVKFCPECGTDIGSFNLKSHDTLISEEGKIEEKIETKKIKKETTLTDLFAYGVIIGFVIIILILGLVYLAGTAGNTKSSQPQYSTQPQNTGVTNPIVLVPTESQTDRNIRIANVIVANYHETHTYSLTDLYVCGDMASDVWDMLKTQGINAKLNVGRVDQDISDIKDANHVWVLAEVAPNSYLALEATGGYSVQKTDNPRYYYGWSFYNPKQLKNYLQLNKQRNDAIDKYNAALADYNNFAAQYNNANFLTKISWSSQLNDKKLIVNQRIQDLNQINQQISALLSSL